MASIGKSRSTLGETSGSLPAAGKLAGWRAQLVGTDGCLVQNLRFSAPLAPGFTLPCFTAMGCRHGCESIQFGCVSAKTALERGVGVHHGCAKPWDGKARAELGAVDKIPCTKISFGKGLRMMETHFDGAPDDWWELLDEPLSNYAICEHVKNRLVSQDHFDSLRKSGSPRLQLYDPITTRYDIEKPPERGSSGSRSAGIQCQAASCISGAHGGRFVVSDRWSKEKKAGALKASPVDGDVRYLCAVSNTSCYRTALKEKNAAKPKKEAVVAAPEGVSKGGEKSAAAMSVPQANEVRKKYINRPEASMDREELLEKLGAVKALNHNEKRKGTSRSKTVHSLKQSVRSLKIDREQREQLLVDHVAAVRASDKLLPTDQVIVTPPPLPTTWMPHCSWLILRPHGDHLYVEYRSEIEREIQVSRWVAHSTTLRRSRKTQSILATPATSRTRSSRRTCSTITWCIAKRMISRT